MKRWAVVMMSGKIVFIWCKSKERAKRRADDWYSKKYGLAVDAWVATDQEFGGRA